jgi:hypothetical protein
MIEMPHQQTRHLERSRISSRLCYAGYLTVNVPFMKLACESQRYV